MKWFKHYTIAHEDEMLIRLMEKFGLEGYGFYFMVLEIVGLQMDEKSRTSLCFASKTWANKLGISVQKFKTIVEFIQKQPESFPDSLERNPLFFIRGTDDVLSIDAPNLLKFRDEYSSRAKKTTHEVSGEDREKLGSESGQTPDSVPIKEVRSKNKEEEKEREKEREKTAPRTLENQLDFEKPKPTPPPNLPSNVLQLSEKPSIVLVEGNPPPASPLPGKTMLLNGIDGSLKFPEETRMAFEKSKNDYPDFLRVVRGLENQYAECPIILQRSLRHFAALAHRANATTLIRMCEENAHKTANETRSNGENSLDRKTRMRNRARRESALFFKEKGIDMHYIRLEIFPGLKDEQIREICPELFECA